jgi:hypothetical protein
MESSVPSRGSCSFVQVGRGVSTTETSMLVNSDPDDQPGQTEKYQNEQAKNSV